MPKIYPKIKEKLKRELKPGAKVLVYVWPVGDWPLLMADCSADKNQIYVYQIN